MAVGEYVGTTYQKIQQAVADYYGSGSDAWARIYAGAGGYYSPEAAQIIQQVPGVSVTYSNSGQVLGYSYANPYPAAGSSASVINSNLQTGSYGTGSFSNSIPSTVVDNGQGQLVAQSGSRLTSTGATVATVVDRLSLAAVGVSLGTKLGKAIDSAIYSLNPTWWDEHYPSINPETWDNMATTQGGRQFIQTLFGLQGDTTTMYMDERLLAQTYMMLLANGAYGAGSTSVSYDNSVKSQLLQPNYAYPNPLSVAGGYQWVRYRPGTGDMFPCIITVTGPASAIPIQPPNGYVTPYWFSRTAFNITANYVYNNGSTFTNSWASTSYDDPVVGQFYYFSGTPLVYPPTPNASNDCYLSGPINNLPDSSYSWVDLARICFLGDTRTVSPLDGVQDDPRAPISISPNTLINPTTGSPVTPSDDPEDVLDALRQQYPDLFQDSIYQDTPQPDGTTTRITYIPTPIPDGITTPTPTTGETSQTDPSVNPDDNTESLLYQIVQLLTHPETQPQTDTSTDPSSDTPTSTPTPPDIGDGNTPIVTPIGGSASSLWKIYNPSQSEIDSFGAWLWSSDFIDQIKKLFNDPMQAIIGVHKVFCTPAIGGTTTIKCGYLDSEVSSNWVSNQYTHIDCGTVNLSEYFGNVFDYDPFTRVSIFLPCVGIVPLDVAEVMRSSISVKLHCDVLTGALLAEVNVIRDQAGGTLYTYSGSCIVTYPVSSGTYMGAVANVVSVAASVAAGIMGTVASGGALAPAAVGAAGAAISGLAHTRTNVQHSGSFSGAAGVMGGKIPYLIITRPQTRMADQYPEYDGVPANFTSRLGDCTGYVKVKEVHLKVSNAYESEIAEIEQLLHQGVLI